MSYQYFIASSTSTKKDILKLMKLLRRKGKTVFSFLETNPLKKPIGEEILVKNWRENEVARYIFEKDMVPLNESETLILLLPAGKSAHIEAGVAYGMGLKCILIGEPEQTDSLYFIFDEDYPSIEKFIESLKD